MQMRKILASRANPVRCAALALACCVGAALAGCGQTGPLVLPSPAQAAQRATLPEIVFGRAAAKPASTPASVLP